ncbi:MAG: amidohydrolase [Synergistaceae bacterium]|nr:amidohydrolase [Synergistaceae bacterium]
MNQENLSRIINLRHELHKFPELSGQENITKRHLMDFLESNTSLAVIDCGRYFYASRYIEGTKAIAFRADMDALPINENLNLEYNSQNPGVSHKCGHDGHCAALCGFALELENLPRERSVYLIFQHAEETGQGGRECSQLLHERNIREIYAFHNWSGYPEKSIIIREGLCQCCSAGLTIKFYGKTSHASEPEKGLNPAYIIADLIKFIGESNKSQKILCTIININLGSKNFGISPGNGEISITMRAYSESIMREFRNQVVNMAESLAKNSGFNFKCENFDYFPETISESESVKRVIRAAKNLNLEIINLSEPFRASEDFGWYTKQVPGAIFYIGNGINYPDIHTSNYDFNDNILEVAINMFTAIYSDSVIK